MKKIIVTWCISPPSSLSPVKGRDIKHAITTANLNCIYLRNNFETFSNDLLSSAPLTRTLFQRAPFSRPFSALFSNLAFETAATLRSVETKTMK